MNLRKTKLYKQLTPYVAIAIAEEFDNEENASEQEQLIAWQYLVDCGIVWQLQGRFGRTAMDLIKAGLIQPSKKGQVIK